MKRIFSFFLFVFFFSSCSNRIPDNVLRLEKMRDVQYDMMRVDEMVEYYRIGDSSYPADQKRKELYTQVMQRHGVTKEEFDRSLAYYSNHPDLLKELLDSIQSSTRQRRILPVESRPAQELTIDSPVPKVLPDSLKFNKFLNRKGKN